MEKKNNTKAKQKAFPDNHATQQQYLLMYTILCDFVIGTYSSLVKLTSINNTFK